MHTIIHPYRVRVYAHTDADVHADTRMRMHACMHANCMYEAHVCPVSLLVAKSRALRQDRCLAMPGSMLPS